MNGDGHIRVLPIHVANKIAAGEVVERPAAVVKELVENALDAGATRVEIALVQGGRKLVSVRDDGCGMSRADALLSLESHATSKIRDVDDVERIVTLGFRGEAVPSIASVSRFTLVTRRAEDEAGTRLAVNAGILAETASCGAPPGTTVEVRDLFCNVPARRKFLASYETETGHAKKVFFSHALARPDVGFALSVDGAEVRRLARGATLEQRVADLYGVDVLESLARVSREEDGVRVHGYVERPDRALPARYDQQTFVNGRPSTAPTIAYALKEAYPRLDARRRPLAILFVEVPPDRVDVNVHPAKREVRFRNASRVGQAVLAALADALSGAPRSAPAPAAVDRAVPAVPAEIPAPSVPAATAETVSGTPDRREPHDLRPFRAPVQRDLPRRDPEPAKEPAFPVGSADGEAQRVEVPTASLWRWFRYLAQTQSGYVLLETDAGVVTFNPQAARERVAYERLLDETGVASQALLIPQVVRLSLVDSAHLKAFRPVLEAQGFALEEFGADAWKVDAVPQVLGGADAGGVIASIVRDVAAGGSRRGTRWREELVAKACARSLAGAAKPLTREAAERLVEDLASTRMPYVDPRGKPVMILVSNRELAHKFTGR